MACNDAGGSSPKCLGLKGVKRVFVGLQKHEGCIPIFYSLCSELYMELFGVANLRSRLHSRHESHSFGSVHGRGVNDWFRGKGPEVQAVLRGL